MPGKMALINFNKCHPQQCEAGSCAAAPACPRKLLTQEAPYEIPMTDPFSCRGCGECATACPLRAIAVVTM
jgi:translation initiation factor RLI1